jgi:hypothetical protein
MVLQEFEVPLWAKRDKINSVCDRAHQINALNYILGYVNEGAAVWSFRDPIPALISLPWTKET